MTRRTLRDHCERLGISIEDLAQRSGLDAERIRAIYDARWTPSPQERAQVAAALELEVEEVGWGHEITSLPFYGHGPGHS